MNVTIVALGLSLAGVCIAALLISLRNSSLNKKLGELSIRFAAEQRSRISHEDALATLNKEIKDREKRFNAHISALKMDITQLEADIAGCRTPGAVRDRILRLLAKTVAAQRDNAPS